MDRPFQTFKQGPYRSAVDFLHEIRSICENAFDLHQSREDPVNGVAKDVHDFIGELLEEQGRLMNGGIENDFEEIEADEEPNCQSLFTSPRTSSIPENKDFSIATASTTTNAQRINLLLLNEVLHQRQMTAELGYRILQVMSNETDVEISKRMATTNKESRWEEHSDSDEDIAEVEKESK